MNKKVELNINASDSRYDYNFLTCFEKPLGIMLGYPDKNYERLYYQYLKFYQVYETESRRITSFYYSDYEDIYKDIVKRLCLKLNTAAPLPSLLHEHIEQAIDQNSPVLVTVNLKELFYSEHYRKQDWASVLIITGYDRDRRLYSTLDPSADRFNTDAAPGELYVPFFLPYEILENMYLSYKESFNYGEFIAFLSGHGAFTPPSVDCFRKSLELFCEDRSSAPYREVHFVDHIVAYLEKGEKIPVYESNGNDSDIDFMMIRQLNCKKMFFKELTGNLLALNYQNDSVLQVKELADLITSKWEFIRNSALMFYKLGKIPVLSEKIKEVISYEEQLKSLIKSIILHMDAHAYSWGERTPFISPDVMKSEAVAVKTQNREGRFASSEILEKVKNIWQQFFQPDPINIKDDFFKSGGHSLSAIKLLTILIKEFEIEIPIDLFFEKPTIEYFAEYIEENINNRNVSLPAKAPALEGYPLSSAQNRMFVMSQLNEAGIVYNETIALEFDGEVDGRKIEKGFAELVKRHEALRTCFRINDGVPEQFVKEECSFQWKAIMAAEEEVDSIISSFVKPFDLFKDPLLRVLFIQLKSRSLLVFDIPHIQVDGVSIGILINELVMFYNDSKLPPLPEITYKDYAFWQKDFLKTEKVAGQVDYWKGIFNDSIPQLNFPLDYSRPSIQTFNGEALEFSIDHRRRELLRNISIEENVTFFVLLFAAFNVLLFKYTDQEDLVVGSPIANRGHGGLHDLVGMFVNMMPLRNRISRSAKFSDILKDIKENFYEAYKNQDCQFDVLVEKLGIKGTLDRNPLFNIVFVLQNVDVTEVELGGIKAVPRQIRNGVAKFDILFEILETAEGLKLIIEYNTALFNKSTMEQFGGHYMGLLDTLIENHYVNIQSIDLLGEEESQKILFDYNATDKPYANDILMHQLFEQQAARMPDHRAVEYREWSLSYSELNTRANIIARTLREKGVGRGSFVAVIINRSLEMIASVLGILKAGGAYIPMEPFLPGDRIKTILNDVKAETLITGASNIQDVLEIVRDDTYIKNIIIPEFINGPGSSRSEGDINCQWISGREEVECGNPEPLQSSEDIAYIIFTSGSTGTPKGVVVKHKPVINLIEWVNKTFNVSHEDRLLFITSLSFDLSVYDIFGILGAGGTVCLKDSEEIREPRGLLDSIINSGITFYDSAPPAMSQLQPYFNELKNAEKSKLRLVFLSGDWIPVTLPDAIRKTFQGASVISLGGATEAAIWSNYYPVDKVEKHWISIPYGKPIQNAKYYILDKNLMPVPTGVHGDLYIGGQCLASGYFNDPELTSRKFIDNPFVPGETIYNTGDRARWFPDGNIEFLGRADFQVKIRGYRIELGEIEATLLGIEEIKEAVVTTRGEARGEKFLIAFFVAEKSFTVGELRQHMAQKLADYMIPSYFIQLDQLPLTSNGKLNRRALEEMKVDSISTGIDYIAPATDKEKIIASIWKEVLECDTIGVDDVFFDIGGSSLSLIKVNDKINRHFNIKIPVVKMFQYPTIRSFDNFLGDLLDEEAGRTKAEAEAEADEDIEDMVSVFSEKLGLMQDDDEEY